MLRSMAPNSRQKMSRAVFRENFPQTMTLLSVEFVL